MATSFWHRLEVQLIAHILRPTRSHRGLTMNVVGFWNFRAHPQCYTISNKATQSNPSQSVPPIWEPSMELYVWIEFGLGLILILISLHIHFLFLLFMCIHEGGGHVCVCPVCVHVWEWMLSVMSSCTCRVPRSMSWIFLDHLLHLTLFEAGSCIEPRLT